MASILQFLSPRAAKALAPVCTLTESTSSMTVSVIRDEDTFIQIHDSPSESPYSQDHDSNQRTRNQFRPRNTTKGTTSYQLRQYAEATLGGGSLRKIVKLPDGEDENEWLAVNSKEAYNTQISSAHKILVVDFYNHINLLYGSITEFCSPQSCPEMKATDEYVKIVDIQEFASNRFQVRISLARRRALQTSDKDASSHVY
jgi:MOB kinase activator 1